MAEKQELDIDPMIQRTEALLLEQAKVAHLMNRNLVHAQLLANANADKAALTGQLEEAASMISSLQEKLNG